MKKSAVLLAAALLIFSAYGLQPENGTIRQRYRKYSVHINRGTE